MPNPPTHAYGHRGEGGSRERTSTQEGWDPGGRPPHINGGRPYASFHWSGARTQELGPYPQLTARAVSKGGTPGKIGPQPLQFTPHRGKPLEKNWRKGKSDPAMYHNRGGGTLPTHPHPHHPSLQEEEGQWVTSSTPQSKELCQGGGDHRGETGIK